MAVRMKIKFDKYWGDIEKVNMILLVAVVLDPRYKLKYVRYCYRTLYEPEQVVEMSRKVREVLDKLYVHYEALSGGFCSKSTNESKSLCGMEVEDAFDADGQMKKQKVGWQRFLEEEEITKNKSEIDHYLDSGCEKEIDNFDILGWWKINSSNYRVLSLMARDVLAVPVSTVASESTFSTGGRVLDSFRSSLTPKIVEALICTQDWLRSSPNLLDVEEKLEELESLESGYFFLIQ
jgi:hypothetical protein